MRYLIEVEVDPRAPQIDDVEVMDQLEDRINAISDIPQVERFLVAQVYLLHEEFRPSPEQAQQIFT